MSEDWRLGVVEIWTHVRFVSFVFALAVMYRKITLVCVLRRETHQHSGSTTTQGSHGTIFLYFFAHSQEAYRLHKFGVRYMKYALLLPISKIQNEFNCICQAWSEDHLCQFWERLNKFCGLTIVLNILIKSNAVEVKRIQACKWKLTKASKATCRIAPPTLTRWWW